MFRTLAALTAAVFLTSGPACAKSMPIYVAPTVTAGLYTANDEVGGLLTFTIDDQAGHGPCTGRIGQVKFHDRSTQEAALVLVLFNQDPSSSTQTDNAAFSVADGDLQYWIDTWSSGTYSSISAASNGVASADPDGSAGGYASYLAPNCKVYGLMYTTGTPTYGTTSDISVTVEFLTDE